MTPSSTNPRRSKTRRIGTLSTRVPAWTRNRLLALEEVLDERADRVRAVAPAVVRRREEADPELEDTGGHERPGRTRIILPTRRPSTSIARSSRPATSLPEFLTRVRSR